MTERIELPKQQKKERYAYRGIERETAPSGVTERIELPKQQKRGMLTEA